MLKHLVILICMQLIKAQYGGRYRGLASEKYQSISSGEDFSSPRQDFINHNHFNRDVKKNGNHYDFDDDSFSEEDFSYRVEKTTSSIFNDINQVIVGIKMKLSTEFKLLNNLEQHNEDKAKNTIQDLHEEFLKTLKTIQETRQEIENRIRYVEDLLYKKRDERTVDTSANVMNCVTDSLSKLSRITPELMKDEEKCISSELDMSRTVARVSLDMLKTNIHKIKQHQERLNKCNTVNRRKPCLIRMYNGLVRFKKNLKTNLAPKMAETVSFLNGLSTRMRTCSMAQIAKVISRAGDVIVKFNNCVKSNNDKEKKSEMLMFVV